MKFSLNSLAIVSSLPPVVCRSVCDQHMTEALIFHAQFTVKADLLLWAFLPLCYCSAEQLSTLVCYWVQKDMKTVFNGKVAFFGGGELWNQRCWGWGASLRHLAELTEPFMLQTTEGESLLPQSCSLRDAARAVLTTAQMRTWDVLAWDGKHWECPGLLQSPVQQPSSLLAPSTPEAFTVLTYPFINSVPWECLIT